MSAERDQQRLEQILRSLHAGRALIIRNALQSDWPAHPGGRLRARPLFWVNRADAELLLEEGDLVATDRGLTLSAGTRPQNDPRFRKRPHDRRMTDETETLIQQLQDRLLALGRDLSEGGTEMPVAEIERTAKAINTLIGGLEKAQGWRDAHAPVARPGDYLRGEARRAFLRKVRILVDRGLLEELPDAD